MTFDPGQSSSERRASEQFPGAAARAPGEARVLTHAQGHGPALPSTYTGVKIYPRGFAAAVEYESVWVPKEEDGWTSHRHVPWLSIHARFPGQLVWKPGPDRVVVSELVAGTPKRAACILAAAAAGTAASPRRVVVYPLAMRIRLRGPGKLQVPPAPHRCRRVWPPLGDLPCIDTVDGVPVELRITTSRGTSGLNTYAELFVGRAHETVDHSPRSMIFGADARYALLVPSDLDVLGVTARLIDLLFRFACQRRDQGLEFDRRPLAGTRLASSRPGDGGSDVEFVIALPQPGGTRRYVGSYVTGLLHAAMSSEVPHG
jgi:hypothetical protein